MQELILVVSRCISKRKNLKGNCFYRFHFKGYYLGQKIRAIHIFPSNTKSQDQLLNKGDDYLLWVKRRKVHLEILEVELIKYKKIN